MENSDPQPALLLPSASPRRAFEHISLSRQFLVAGLVLLLAGMGVVGSWLSIEIERSAVQRAAAVSAIYVESILAAQLRKDTRDATAIRLTHEALDQIFIAGPLQRKVVRFKLWNAFGTIIYSNDHAQHGMNFPLGKALKEAFIGKVQAHMSALKGEEHFGERGRWDRLLEVYAPVRLEPQGEVIAVAEFYHSTENIDREIRSAQWRSWLLVTVTTLAILLLLFGTVRRVDETLLRQRDDLRRQLGQLSAAFADNERMRMQLGEAGAATTALNERLLHRIAADLHDGPAQSLAFALMRFDEMVGACGGRAVPDQSAPPDLRAIRDALRMSLDELRNIAAGMGMPGIAESSLVATAQRAVRDFERRNGLHIAVQIDETLVEADLATKITVYRLLQESLANCLRHAPGAVPEVRVWRAGDRVCVEIADSGPGFDTAAAADSGRLGLAFMQERVRLLGGEFGVESAPDSGTRIHACLPLSNEDSKASS